MASNKILTKDFHVIGMLCLERCGYKIAIFIESVSGVESASLDFEKRIFHVVGQFQVEELMNGIEKMGYSAILLVPDGKQIKLHRLMIENVQSPLCEEIVKKALKSVVGVESVIVNTDQKEALVLFSSIMNESELLSAVEHAGCSATLIRNPIEMAIFIIGNDDNRNQLNIIRNMLLSTEKVVCAKIDPSLPIIRLRSSDLFENHKRQLLEMGIDCRLVTTEADQVESKTEVQPDLKALGHMGDIRATFSVSDMTCGACVSTIETALSRHGGVIHGKVALLTERAEVLFDSKQTSSSEILDLIDGIGYGCTLIEERNAKVKVDIRDIAFQVHVPSAVDQTSLNDTPRAAHANLDYQSLGQLDNIDNNFINWKNVVESRIRSLPGVLSAEIVQDSSPHQMGFFSRFFLSDNNDNPFCSVAIVKLQYEPEVISTRAIYDELSFMELNPTISQSAADIQKQGIVAKSEEEVRLLERKFALSLFLTSCIMIIMYIPMLFPAAANVDLFVFLNDPIYFLPHVHVYDLLMWALSTPVQFICGWGFYVASYKGLVGGTGITVGMPFLVSLGTSVSYGFGVLSIIHASLIPRSEVNVQVYSDFFMTSSMLLTFILFGKILEAAAKRRTSSAIIQLMSIQCKTAILVEAPSKQKNPSSSLLREQQTIDREIPIELVATGDILRVIRGSQVPVDGNIVHGEIFVDESIITGESMPLKKVADDNVIGGTTVVDGAANIRVTDVGEDMVLRQIVRLVEEAQMSKPPIQALADTIAGHFAIIITIISVCVFFIWYLVLSFNLAPSATKYIPEIYTNVVASLLFSVSTLVIACPCAIGLATPTAIMVGTGVGAKNGILIKGGEALEVAHKVDCVVFDKTGTLTIGKPSVTGIKCMPLFTSNVVLTLTASAELNSEHPLGQAIVRHARSAFGVSSVVEPQRFCSTTSKGVDCLVHNRRILVGSGSWLEENGISVQPLAKDVSMVASNGNIVVHCAIDGQLAGVIFISDPPRQEASATVHALISDIGVEVYMLTGDHRQTALSVAASIGIPENNVVAQCLPSTKIKFVKGLQEAGKIVAFVGDGVNDSPALAQANVGIAIGQGTDIAVEAAGLVLVRSDLWSVVTAIDLSRSIMKTVYMNFIYAVTYNLIALPLASGLFITVLKLIVPPYAAGAAMALSSVSVVSSSLLLLLYKPPVPRNAVDVNWKEKSKNGLLSSASMSKETLDDSAVTSSTKLNNNNAAKYGSA